MSNPRGLRKRLPTAKQAKTAQGIIKRLEAGEPLSKDLMIEETAKVYDLKEGKSTIREQAATIVGQNLRKPVFLATLGLTDPDAQLALKEFLWQGLMGENPKWKNDKQLAMKCADLLSKGAIASREQVVHSETGDFEGRSIDELLFYERYDRFPNKQELDYFKQTGTIDRSGVQ